MKKKGRRRMRRKSRGVERKKEEEEEKEERRIKIIMMMMMTHLGQRPSLKGHHPNFMRPWGRPQSVPLDKENQYRVQHRRSVRGQWPWASTGSPYGGGHSI